MSAGPDGWKISGHQIFTMRACALARLRAWATVRTARIGERRSNVELQGIEALTFFRFLKSAMSMQCLLDRFNRLFLVEQPNPVISCTSRLGSVGCT